MSDRAIIYGEAGDDFDAALAAVEAACLEKGSVAVPVVSPTIDAGATDEEIIAGTRFKELPTMVDGDTVYSGLTAIESALS